MEIISQHGSLLWPGNLVRVVAAWGSYARVELKLSLYEYYVSFQRALGRL
jgi:aarF domain-containing kinase